MKEKVILCIDDEKTILDSLKSQLIRNFGDKYIYEFAENAYEGLEVLEEIIHDNLQILVIVSDWLMPGMKGDEFLIEVKKRYPEIKAILLTGQADDKAIELANKNANLLTCLRKPWDEKNLIETINKGLN